MKERMPYQVFAVGIPTKPSARNRKKPTRQEVMSAE